MFFKTHAVFFGVGFVVVWVTEMSKNKRTFWTAALVLSIIIIIVVLGYLCQYLLGIYTSGNEYNDLKEITSSVSSANNGLESEIDILSDNDPNISDSSQESSAVNEEVSDSGEDKQVINGDINFTELWEINTDIYAWIKIPNTLVDYPLVQSETDDSFYLSHNIYKEYAFAGSIYTESLNSKDFSDPNTLIYGHNMLNGSMFATLHNFRDPNFFAANEYIYVYLPERTLTYRIFAAYEYDDRHILYSFDFGDEDVYQKYLDYAQNPTSSMTYNIRDLGVTTDDKIITLSTCMDNIDTSRYLVQGVLVKDESTE